MTFVLDASVAISWAFEDENHEVADRAWRKLEVDGALVPMIWRTEVCNVLIVNERRERIQENAAESFLRTLGRLPIAEDREANPLDLMATARAHRLSAYDAAYLELALRRAAPLATLDVRLADAAKTAGVQLV